MKKVYKEIKSYLFEGENGQFRATTFYNLATDEYVIYQNKQAKYLLDLNLQDSLFVIQIRKSMSQGFNIEEIIYRYSVYLGLDWTIKYKIENRKIPNSQQMERLELEVIESFADVAHELIFIATDDFLKSNLINDEELFEEYFIEDKNVFFSLESFFIDRHDNIEKLIEFIFKKKIELIEIQREENIVIYDLSQLIGRNINLKQFENTYQEWLEFSDRDNTMEEYGQLMGVIACLERNLDKKQLVLRVEKKLLPPTIQ